MKELRAQRKEIRKRNPPLKRKALDFESPPASPPLTIRTRSTSDKDDANYRIVNWDFLSKQLESCTKCKMGPLSVKNTTSERRAGLAYLMWITCDHCKEINIVRTDEVHEEVAQRGPKRSKLNERCVLGALHSGNGHAQLDHLLAPMDIKCMASKTYKAIERRVGPQIEEVARKSCSDWLVEEGNRSDGNNLAISYDMGWQKRGKARNSRTGQGIAVGQSTGKIIDYETKTTSCRKCENASKSGGNPSSHDCRVNHSGSSKSMEPAAAAEIYKRAKANGIRYTTFIGDEDSTTIARVRQEVGEQ